LYKATAREVSRFARNSRDWQQLIEMCRVVDTVLIDQEMVYAPRQGNDRLLLGLKCQAQKARKSISSSTAPQRQRPDTCRLNRFDVARLLRLSNFMLNPAMKNGFPYAALRRFDNETHRIDGVMNPGLFNKRYLAAGQYTIADMICYPWASQTHSWRDTDSNLRQASFNFDPPDSALSDWNNSEIGESGRKSAASNRDPSFS
jgi:hypothetical protein